MLAAQNKGGRGELPNPGIPSLHHVHSCYPWTVSRIHSATLHASLGISPTTRDVLLRSTQQLSGFGGRQLSVRDSPQCQGAPGGL
jgi:hypothetical protein